MKKIMSTLLALIMCFMSITMLSSCQSGTGGSSSVKETEEIKEEIQKNLISEAVSCIESENTEEALIKIKAMNDSTKDEARETITSMVIINLDLLSLTNAWIETDSTFIDETVLKKLSDYRDILNEFSWSKEEDSTALEFIETALKLEEYTKYNEFYEAISSSYITDINAALDAGLENYTSAYSTALSYFEEAYAIASEAYEFSKDKTALGMPEFAEYFKQQQAYFSYVKEGNSAPESVSEDLSKASEALHGIIDELQTVYNDEVKAIIADFPDEIK